MSPGLTMERVYDALKTHLMSGALLPRQRLDPARLAVELNTSTTPVRDALHRLMGERLVEGWPHEGFHVPAVSESRLRNLYTWNQTLLVTCLKLRAATNAAPTEQTRGTDAPDIPHAVAQLFAGLAHRAGNEEWDAAIINTGNRLHAVRHAEAHVFDDLEPEFESLSAASHTLQGAPLHQAIARYHRRRIRKVAEICSACGQAR